MRDVSFFDAADEQWSKNENGALVEVKPWSWPSSPLYVGDLTLKLRQPVDNVDALRRNMENVVASKSPC